MIQDRIRKLAEITQADVVIIEIGGMTETLRVSFLEAIREFALNVGYNNALLCM